MNLLSSFWLRIQQVQLCLFPIIEEDLGSPTDKEMRLVEILELVRIEELFPPTSRYRLGRPRADRAAIARAFVAKAVLNIATTVLLLESLNSRPRLRRICGWERASDVPSETTFSNAFKEFANSALAERTHEQLVRAYGQEKLVGHLSADSTMIPAREKAAPKHQSEPLPAESTPAKPKKRGRPRKGEAPPAPEPTRMKQQAAQLAEADPDDRELLAAMQIGQLPTACDWGSKKNSQGRVETTKGYKLHLDVADGGIPIVAVVTGASVHDSQVALPLKALGASRVTALYDLADAAYDAAPILEFSRSLGRIPIIDRNPRRGGTVPMEPATARRYDERTTVERVNGRLKDEFGALNLRVKGTMKVTTHLMFSVLALTADQLIRLVS